MPVLHALLTHSWPALHCTSEVQLPQLKFVHTWPALQLVLVRQLPKRQKPALSQRRPAPPHAVLFYWLRGLHAWHTWLTGLHSCVPPLHSPSLWQVPLTHAPEKQICPPPH